MSKQGPVGERCGDDISEERQAELKVLADKQRELSGKPLAERIDRSHFRVFGLFLSGADVFWLAAYAQAIRDARVRQLLPGPTEWSEYFAQAQRNLRTACGYTDYDGPPLFVDLSELHLEGADLERANLAGAYLSKAHLEGASLPMAHLKGADLRLAHLEGANLYRAHLEGANLSGACLEGANLRRTWLDSETVLSGAALNDKTCLGDIHWGGVGSVDLTSITWDRVPPLGDEQGMDRSADTSDRAAVVRVYRQLAVQLRIQGLNEDADRFAYRAQLMQRRVLRRQAFLWEKGERVGLGWRLRKLTAYLGSGLLDLIAGYGYRPGRSLVAYLAVICAFAGLYLLNGQFASPHLRWDEALVLSISSFHGRGFFTTGVSLGDTLARLAAGEAILGLLLEITFIATFTQRFFAR